MRCSTLVLTFLNTKEFLVFFYSFAAIETHEITKQTRTTEEMSLVYRLGTF